MTRSVVFVRRALSSVAVGLAGVAAVSASGWALQVAALPPPTPATRLAADASAWFHDYRLVVDVFHLDHRRLKGACLRGWFPDDRRRKTRASLFSLESEPILRVPERRHPWRAAGRRTDRRLRTLALVGCSGELAPILAAAAQTGGRLSTERSYAANQPAVALELEHSRRAHLTVYVSARTHRPLVAFVDYAGRTATARLFLVRAKPSRLNAFHFGSEIRGGT